MVAAVVVGSEEKAVVAVTATGAEVAWAAGVERTRFDRSPIPSLE